MAYDRYVNRLGEHTLVFYDTEQVTPSEGAKGTHIGYNFREMSIELGNPAVANTIALGLIAKKTSMLRRNSLVSAIQEYFSAKPKVIGVNIQALDAGMALG